MTFRDWIGEQPTDYRNRNYVDDLELTYLTGASGFIACVRVDGWVSHFTKEKRMPDYNPYAGLVEEVLDLIRDWQIEGRNGHCLPVIRGRLLEGLEEAANDRAQDNCTICNGTGKVSDGYED